MLRRNAGNPAVIALSFSQAPLIFSQFLDRREVLRLRWLCKAIAAQGSYSSCRLKIPRNLINDLSPKNIISFMAHLTPEDCVYFVKWFRTQPVFISLVDKLRYSGVLNSLLNFKGYNIEIENTLGGYDESVILENLVYYLTSDKNIFYFMSQVKDVRKFCKDLAIYLKVHANDKDAEKINAFIKQQRYFLERAGDVVLGNVERNGDIGRPLNLQLFYKKTDDFYLNLSGWNIWIQRGSLPHVIPHLMLTNATLFLSGSKSKKVQDLYTGVKFIGCDLTGATLRSFVSNDPHPIYHNNITNISLKSCSEVFVRDSVLANKQKVSLKKQEKLTKGALVVQIIYDLNQKISLKLSQEDKFTCIIQEIAALFVKENYKELKKARISEFSLLGLFKNPKIKNEEYNDTNSMIKLYRFLRRELLALNFNMPLQPDEINTLREMNDFIPAKTQADAETRERFNALIIACDPSSDLKFDVESLDPGSHFVLMKK